MAAGSTYTPIATYTLASNGTVTFSSIPQTYTDLRLVFNGGITNDYWDMGIRFNSDSGSNYSQTSLFGDGATPTSSKGTSVTRITTGFGSRNNLLNLLNFVDIMNYSNTTTYKNCLIRSNNADSGTAAGSSAVIGMWRNTSAINSIFVYCPASNNGQADLYAGSTLTLYGITAA